MIDSGPRLTTSICYQSFILEQVRGNGTALSHLERWYFLSRILSYDKSPSIAAGDDQDINAVNSVCESANDLQVLCEPGIFYHTIGKKVLLRSGQFMFSLHLSYYFPGLCPV